MRNTDNAMRDASSGVDLRQVRIGRTPEGTAYEAVCAVLVLVSWVAVVLLSLRGESTDAGVMVLNAVGGMVVTVLCLAAAYHPLSMINLPFKPRTVGQVVLMSRMARVIAVGVAVLSLVQTCMVADCAARPCCGYASHALSLRHSYAPCRYTVRAAF